MTNHIIDKYEWKMREKRTPGTVADGRGDRRQPQPPGDASRMTHTPRRTLSSLLARPMAQLGLGRGRTRPAGATLERLAGHKVVASYNIHKCVGTDRRFDPARIAAVIGEIDADVLALQEADRRFGEREGLLDLAMIERRTGLVPVRLGHSRRSHGWHGNVLLFRDGEVREVRRIRLPGAEPRGALRVDLELADGPLRVVAAHLGLLRRSRMKQVEKLAVEMLGEGDVPTVLLGDLNERRECARSSLLALHERFGTPEPFPPTFPSRFPIWPLDRVIANAQCTVVGVETHDTPLARIASDHLPLKAALRLGTDAQRAAARGRIAA